MKTTFSLLLITLAPLLPKARAVSPPPDGGYAGFNTAEGQNALFALTIGVGNTAVGWYSLWSNTEGSYNTALGAGTLLFNIGNTVADGTQNTAVGAGALLNNTSGSYNTANGALALFSNTSNIRNTAVGAGALFSNSVGGDDNTAVGAGALGSNQSGPANTAVGAGALGSNPGGFQNSAFGWAALGDMTSGNYNLAVGDFAMANTTVGSFNVAIGSSAMGNSSTIGDNNIALGPSAGLQTDGSNNIVIGNEGASGESNTTRIGAQGTQTATYIAGISGVAVAGDPVIVNSNGQLGVAASSKRFKDEIKPMGEASEAVLALKPVTFRYKDDLDPKPITRFGLVAEEVQKVDPDLVARDAKGEPYTVRYEAVNAMLLNEFIKEHRKVEAQEATIVQQRRDFETSISQLKKEIDTLAARLKEQDANIQKVSAQLEVCKAAPQVVLNKE